MTDVMRDMINQLMGAQRAEEEGTVVLITVLLIVFKDTVAKRITVDQ